MSPVHLPDGTALKPIQSPYYIVIHKKPANLWIEVEGESCPIKGYEDFDLFYHEPFDTEHYKDAGELRTKPGCYISCGIIGRCVAKGEDKREARKAFQSLRLDYFLFLDKVSDLLSEDPESLSPRYEEGGDAE